MSPPSTPKPRNRLQQFLKDPGPFTRSHSRSQSASPSPLPYLDPSPATGPKDKGAGPLTSSNIVTLPADKTAVGTSVVDSSYATASATPVFLEPADIGSRAVRLGQQPVPPNSISANAVSPSLAPVDSGSGPLDTVSDITTGELNGASPRLLSLGPEHALCSGILPESAAPRNTIMLVPGQKIRNAVWDQLRVSLQFLRNISTRFPQFDSAIESLLSCLDGFEGAVRNRQDYEDLATELTVLSESLGQHIEGLSFALMSHCVVSIVMSVQRQVEEIQDRLRQTLGGSIREAALVMHYRQIQAHFRLLEKNANMSTWRPVDEQLENTRLEGLRPAREATYDSSLSTVIGRRTCTEGTRTTVLADLEDWLYDPTALPIYWMNGMAGTGKTTIMSTFCKRAEHPKLLAASFFCTRSSAECRDVTRIVPTIAYQLAQYSIPFRSHLCQILGQNLDTGSKNLLKQFEQLLLEPLKQSKDSLPEHLVVVIDALDECENRAGVELILDILLRSVAEVPLKFLITSRPEPEIYERLIGYSSQQVRVIHLHEIKNSLVQADIELYLTEELGFISPDSTDIEQLVKRSGYLFIYAATLVRYILGGKRLANPRKRLKWVLGTTPEATKVQRHIDALYTAVLRSALSEDETEPDKVEDIRAVLRTVLSAQEPISVETIATLAGMSDPQRAQFALLPLRAVLHQTEGTKLVSTLHASFSDFMLSERRSGLFFCNIVEHSQFIAERSFLVMKGQLRFNICQLESSFVLDHQLNDIQDRINQNISPTLAYVSRYWASHLVISRKSESLQSMLDEFLCSRLLFWMEILNLRREMEQGIEELQKAERWLKQVDCTSTKLGKLVADAHNFVAGFVANPTKQSTPHIYISSLPFCPRSSLVHENYWKRVHGVLKLNGSLMEQREVIALATWALGSNVLSVAYLPFGAQIAVGCFDKTVRLLNAYDGVELVTPLQGHTEIVHSVAFSSDGRFVASGSYDGTVRVWKTNTGTPVCVTPPQEINGKICHVNSVSFSPDGRRVVSGSVAGTIRLFNALDGTPLPGPLEGHNDWVRCVTFSPDGTLIASASDDHTIRLWHSHNGSPASSVFMGHTHWVMSVAFSPDGTRLASGSRDRTIRVWNIPDGSLASHPFEGHTGTIYSVVISSNGTRVASGSGDGTIRVWNIDNGMLAAGPFRLIDYTGSAVLATSVTFSPDGTRVISGAYNRTVHVWDLRYGNNALASPPSMPHKTISKITSLGFPPDSTHVLSSSPDSTIRVWNTSDGTSITGLGKGLLPSSSTNPFSPVYSPDGRYLASSFENSVLHIMSMTTGAIVARLTGAGNRPLSAFRFLQNSSCVMTGDSDGIIQVQNIQTRQILAHSFTGHAGAVSSISQSLDSSLLATYSNKDKTIRIWDMLAPRLDLGNQLSSSPEITLDGMHKKSWKFAKDGWVFNNNNEILFWLPADIAPIWRSPYASLIVTEYGTLEIPRQKLLVGSMWSKCFIV